MRSLLLLPAILCVLQSTPAQGLFTHGYYGEFDPGRFRSWARGSVNILETYQDYKETYRDLRPKRYDPATKSLEDRKNAFFVMLDGNSFIPILDSTANYVEIRTTEGPMVGTLQKSFGSAHVSYLAEEWEIGMFGLMDKMFMFLERDMNLHTYEIFEGYDKEDGPDFSAGYTIASVFFRWRDLEADVGYQNRVIPLTTRDTAGGAEIFRLRRNADSVFTGTEERKSLFLDLYRGDYHLSTLYSLRESIEFMGLGMGTFGVRGYTVVPFLRYAKHRTRFQAGAEVRRRFFDALSGEAEIAGDVHRDVDGNFAPYGHVVAGPSLSLFRLPRARLSEFDRYDFRVLLDYDFSVSTDAVDRLAIGHAAVLALEEIAGVVSVRWGIGYNDYRHLSLFPVGDAFALNIGARIAW